MTQYPPPMGVQQSPQGQMMQPHRGGLILALGILGLLACFICGIFAWMMGNQDEKMMNAGMMDPSGRGMTQAGKIIGMISVILACLGVVMAIIWIIFAVLLAGAAAASGN